MALPFLKRRSTTTQPGRISTGPAPVVPGNIGFSSQGYSNQGYSNQGGYLPLNQS